MKVLLDFLYVGKPDIIKYECVNKSPCGYGLKIIFALGYLSKYVDAFLKGYLAAVDASPAAAKSGNTSRQASEANVNTLRGLDFPNAGKHLPACHSTGLDGSDGPSSSPDFVMKSNIVLSFHPGTVLEDNRGFLISDNFLVTPEGAARLSPHHASQ